MKNEADKMWEQYSKISNSIGKAIAIAIVVFGLLYWIFV